MKKVSFYIRVSSLAQAKDGFSIEAQKHELMRYSKLNQLQVIRIYVDEGITGTSMQHRKGLKELIEDANKGEFEELLVWKISRLARNVQDLLEILKVFNDRAIVLRSISENLATDSLSGTFTLQMMGAVAELEREVIVENIKLGVAQRLRQGWYSGAPILGYDTIPKETYIEKKLKSNLIINKQEAEIVKYIYDLYEQGKGYKAITNILNSKEIKSKKEKKFSTSVVKKILERRLYTGEIEYKIGGKTEVVQGHHEAIINLEQWESVERIRKKNKVYKQKNQRIFTLNKLLKCPICGSTLIPKVIKIKDKNRKKEYYYYICIQYHNKGIKACSAQMVEANQIEKDVYTYLQEYIQNKKVIRDVYKKLNTNDKTFKAKMKSLNNLKIQEEKIRKRQKLLMIQFESTQISKEEFVRKVTLIKQQLEMLKIQIQEDQEYLDQHTKTEVPIEIIEKAFRNIAEVLQQGQPILIKEILQTIIKKISLNNERKIDNIEFKINLSSNLLEKEERIWRSN